MVQENGSKKESKIKKFFTGWMRRLDRALEEKARTSRGSCCGGDSQKGDGSCCS